MLGRRAWGTGRLGRACAIAVAVIAAALSSGVATAAAAPNLVVFRPPYPLGGPVGGSLPTSVLVKNTGTSRAGSSSVRAWLSTDRVLSLSSDIVTGGTGRMKPLAAGRLVAVRWQAHIRASTPVGVPYYLIVCTDVTGRVRESSEADNCRASRTRARFFRLKATIDYPEVGATTGRNTTVSYSTNAYPVTATCSLDGGPAVACQSIDGIKRGYGSKRYTNLAGGMHTVVVRLRHKTGATAAASRSWTVDVTPPTVYFVEGSSDMPAEGAIVTAYWATIWFASDDTDMDSQWFWCKLDGEVIGWGCVSPYDLEALANGPHAFSVRAKDDYGNVGATITRHWIVNAS